MKTKKITMAAVLLFWTMQLFPQATQQNLVVLEDEHVRIEESTILDRHHRIIEPPGDIWSGFTRMIPFRRMIPPYGLEVTSEKTVHIIFPAPIVYVDLGNEDIMAATAGEATNVLRVKAATPGFTTQTNLAVITANGSFYSFNVRYARVPRQLNIEMQDFLNSGNAFNRPNNAMDIFLAELQNESPMLVSLIMRSIYSNNQRFIRHIGSRMFGIQYTLKGIFSHGGLLYFHVEIRNSTNVNFDIDYFNFTVQDKQVAQRTTVQEISLRPVRAHNFVTTVAARQTENIVLAFPMFTLPPDKVVRFNVNEQGGGRHQNFTIDGNDLMRAREIREFHIR